MNAICNKSGCYFQGVVFFVDEKYSKEDIICGGCNLKCSRTDQEPTNEDEANRIILERVNKDNNVK